MHYISLFWPEDETTYSSKTKNLSNATAGDFDLNGLCESIAKTKEESETIKEIFNTSTPEEATLWRLFSRFKELRAMSIA